MSEGDFQGDRRAGGRQRCVRVAYVSLDDEGRPVISHGFFERME